jgi:hypothetical protein
MPAGPIVFVIGQAGSAAYCVPLWRKWLHENPGFAWHVLANDEALNIIQREGLKDCSVTPLQQSITPQLEKLKPACIICSASDKAYEREASSYAAQQNIPHLQVLDAWYNYASRIRESNPPGRLPDHILLIDEWARQEAIETGLPSERLYITGHPMWETKLNAPQNKEPKNILVFAAQPISEIPSLASIGYDERSVWAYLLDFQAKYSHLAKELIYCPHPSQKNPPASFPKSARLLNRDENALYAGGTMIGMFSALMIEGVLVGQTVISLQPGLKSKNLCALSRQNYIPLITDAPQTLRQTLENPEKPSIEPLITTLQNSLARFETAIFNAASLA